MTGKIFSQVCLFFSWRSTNRSLFVAEFRALRWLLGRLWVDNISSSNSNSVWSRSFCLMISTIVNVVTFQASRWALQFFHWRLEDLLWFPLPESRRLGYILTISPYPPVPAMSSFFDAFEYCIRVFNGHFGSTVYKHCLQRHEWTKCQKFLLEPMEGCVSVEGYRYVKVYGLAYEIVMQ